ncbi:autotransporter-associated beta strand repeat-containing protein [Haloferula sp. BvORR071]|uniref:beta strand repeat-containing protein n=1 Tax=Haloferula sp. BvORR071 TaxID=1396141 RepID=UPI000A52FE12|nr:autotransporter-associated beta strand repeat-containing protein [Haloferula sp. BvORR071]
MTLPFARAALRSSIISLSIHTVVAADGVWTNPAGGSWADAANWSGSTIADGSGAIADFSTLDIAADTTVTLDGARTIGTLHFADAATASNDWTLAAGSGGPLTLAATGTPGIAVDNRAVTLGMELAGTQGFTKTGAGALSLSGGNTFLGPLQVAAGTLRAASATALGAGGAGNETAVASGATFDVNGSALTATEIVQIAGSGVGGVGALVNNGGAQQNALNKVVLTGNATVGGSARFDVRPGTTPTLDLAGFTLTKTGANQFSMVGTAITAGNVVINQGTFSVETTSTMTGTGSTTINSPGILGLYGNGDTLITRPIVSYNGTIQNLGSDANINTPISITTGTTLTLTGSNTTNLRTGVISGTGSISKTGTGTFATNLNHTFVGKTSVTGGYMGMHGEGALGPAPASFQADQLTLDGGGIYDVAAGVYFINGGPVFSGTRGITLGPGGGIFDAYGALNSRSRIGLGSLISGPGKLTKNGGGYIELSFANTYAGGTTIGGGPDIADTTPNGAFNVSNYGGFGPGAINFVNGSSINGLRFTTTGTLTNDITLNTTAVSTTRFVVDSGAITTISGAIDGGNFDGPEFQSGGAGTLILSGDKNYSSDTVAVSGKLLVNGNLPASDAVARAGASIGGTGMVRMLTLEEGSNIIASTPPLGTLFGVTANKTTNGVGIVVPNSSATPGLKTVDLVYYGDDVDGLAPDTANFNTAAYRGASVANDTVNNKITMSYTSSALTWSGLGTVWDAGTTPSWVEGSGIFYQGDAVSFNEPSAATTVTMTGGLAPSAVTVTNTTNAYTFGGTGSIITGSLVKNGTGMLVLPTANSFAGGTTINGGTVSLSLSATASGSNNPGALGSGPVTVNTGALLKLWIANGTTSYFSNPITLDGGRILGEDGINVLKGGLTLAAGGGTLSAKWNNKNTVVDSVISGPGKLTVFRETPSGETGASVVLNKANTYTGGTDILSGFLRVAYTDAALSSGTLTFTGAGTFATAVGGGARNIANPVVINTGIVGSLDGGQFPLTMSGPISGPGTLQSTSSGLIVLSGTNSYTGGTNFTGTGLMRLDSPGALGTTGTLSFTGGTMQASAANTTDYSARFSTAAGQIYRIDTNGQTVTWASPLLSSTGALWKYGAGTLIVTGASVNTGSTNIQGGVIESAVISDVAGAPLSTGLISFGGGTLRYTGPSATTARALWNDQVSGVVEVTNPAAVLTFTSTGGTVNKPFTKSGPGSLVLTDSIDGAGTPVTVSGGSLTLNGTNTYTGDTIVSAGSLTLATASLANAADVRIGASAVLNLGHALTDDVRSLYIDGVLQAAGTWGSLSSTATNKTARITGTGILNVLTGAVGGAYDSWASAAGLTGANNGKTVDADGDGLDNITEFALDGPPLSGAVGGKMVSKIATIGGQQVLTLTLPVRSGASFSGTTELVSGAVDGVIYRIQGSAVLASFPLQVLEVTGADATALQSGLPAVSSGWTYRSFRLAGPVSSADKGFMRVVITQG